MSCRRCERACCVQVPLLPAVTWQQGVRRCARPRPSRLPRHPQRLLLRPSWVCVEFAVSRRCVCRCWVDRGSGLNDQILAKVGRLRKVDPSEHRKQRMEKVRGRRLDVHAAAADRPTAVLLLFAVQVDGFFAALQARFCNAQGSDDDSDGEAEDLSSDEDWSDDD